MERALVIGESGGIGAALAAALRARLGQGAVVGLSRRRDGLDVTDEASVVRALGALEGPFDLVVVATGALEGAGHPPEKALKEVTPEALAAQFAVNAMGPLLVLKHAARLIPRDRRAVVAVLSARVGSIGDNGLGGWYAYRMAKAALNQGLHTAAIELGRSHRHCVCVALHPGTVATPFTAAYAGRHKTVPPEVAAENLLGVIDGLGPEESGRFFDWAGQAVPW
ncbi:NAD(P)-dependent dehydrogenase (short-subunit alcohol dehydrogenase family) [Rhodovulum iodosum]|uniref:NAD(P)-dependent dehydrogenase (Short-subunit alcohol dehydrogenase family) n=1 Tax=Rhodovulum iodosum TaxID=68291 RepID=A0ABV3XU10_9RHOB|nr:SDR family oxidoreductase [Rhodovulum robiginosum]RSK32252.1 SDR family oxidoreductase [Rhodovulum robiginosum]